MLNLPALLQNKTTRIGPFPWKRSVLQNPDRERTNQSTGICLGLGLPYNKWHYLPCVISDSVHKRVELNKRSLDNGNSGNEKHERHDQHAIMDSCIRTMHTMRGSSKQNCSPYSYMYYNPQHDQLIMALSRRMTLCNTSTLLLGTSF